MNIQFTTADIEAWVQERRTEIMEGYERFITRFPYLPRSPNTERVWQSAWWLKAALTASGATAPHIVQISFCLGQRSLAEDPYVVAAQYANEFTATWTVADKPGKALAMEVHRQLSQRN